MRALRKKIALTQFELGQRLGVSRKTIVGWEASEDPLDDRIALQVRNAAGQVRVIEHEFRVDTTITGTYAVVRQRVLALPVEWAAGYVSGDTMLFGEFKRRDHAYRWSAALQRTADPRNTRSLIKKRAKEHRASVS